MKVYLICGVFCAIGFFAMGMQMGLFSNEHKLTSFLPGMGPPKKAVPRAKFPQELAPAAQARPVPIAAAFTPDDRPHKLAFLKPNGGLHSWHESVSGYNEDWYTDRVEEAELVVVVGNSEKAALSIQTYPNGAPPITRYLYTVEASLVEAKTGRVLANRRFQNVPRAIRPIESWETTALGSPVSYHTVFRWAANIAKIGPPAVPVTTPIVNTVE